MKQFLVRVWKEEDGQDLTEYALLVVLISLIGVLGMKTLGSAICDAFGGGF